MDKKIPAHIKGIIAFFIIIFAILTFLFIFYPTQLSAWTHGVLFGVNVESLSIEELETGDIRPVTEKEIKSYQKFAKRYLTRAKKALTDEDKDTYEVGLALPQVISDIMHGNLPTTQEAFEAHMEDLLASMDISELEKLETEFHLDSPLTLTAYATNTEEFEFTPEMEAQANANIISHNFAEALYMAGGYDLSAAFAALTAMNAPRSDATANLLGNILKQNDDLYNSLKMYQYAIRLEPTSEAALVGAGNTCLDLQKYDEAAYYFNRALAVTGGSGLANQGMMLVSFSRGDDHSAYLYMIEGAKDGYTSILTDAYSYFRNKYKTREAYLEFAGPILDQYGFKHLTDFTRSRTMFDETLDTPGQQLDLDRTLVLPNNGADVWHSSLVSLFNGTYEHMMALLKALVGEEALTRFMADGDFSALFTSPEAIAYMAEYGFSMSGMGDSLNELASSMKDEDSSIMDMAEDIIDLASTTKDNLGYNPPAATGADGSNYEQEVFWMRILYDYTEYKFIELTEKYCSSLENKYFYDNLDVSLLKLEKLTDKWTATGERAMIIHFLTCFISNGSPIADRQYTLEEVERMGKQLCGFNPYLKKGYMECIMLAEEYWLHTNNILAYIADDAVYNRMRITRDQMAVRVATYFPMMAGTFHGTTGITAPVWAGITFDWRMNSDETNIFSALHGIGSGEYVTYPKVPKLPVTGMGTEPKPPIRIKVVFPSMEQLSDPVMDSIGGSGTGDGTGGDSTGGGKDVTLTIKVEADDDSMVQVETQGTIMAEDPNADSQPQSQPDSDIQTTYTENPESTLTIGFEFRNIGFSFNPDTLAFEVSVKSRVKWHGAKFSYNPVTNDLTAYVQAGFDESIPLLKSKKWLNTSIGTAVGAKAVLFLQGTVNLDNLSTTSVDSGATVEAQFLDDGFGSTMSYDLVSGVTKDTAHRLIDGRKHVLETAIQTDEGFLNKVKDWLGIE
ncbi:MAG: hypothetical protein IJO55_07845 [Lachnospiraceae bacterium]|nr:hypothetical protein [Lachnospiraceae bacterium]